MQSKLDAYVVVRRGVSKYSSPREQTVEDTYDIEIGSKDLNLTCAFVEADLIALVDEINNILKR